MPETCPCCQRVLDKLAPGRGPAFLCTHCHRAWYRAELTPTAKAAWDPATRSFGYAVAAELARAIKNEVN